MLRRRPVLVVLACTLTSTVLVGCSSSAPAQLEPSRSAAVVAPEPSPAETLLPDTTPTGSQVGGLAAGFPSALLPVPAGATVLLSAAAPVPDSDLVDVSLNLRTTQSASDLLEAVSGPLEKAGFTRSESPEREPDLAAQAAFTRDHGKERVILGILDADGVRTLTLSGQVDPSVT
ncbi:hypothetical protein [Cellulomonas edaphi]|uniref:Uncharacterized protein n=1 Tax=Cellulomonas edaphi TaxID=3053468 RepID=A0ABT7S701_9CELL|nr:hypothetical protein [Cellulomons edaphi]MDM7831395.1 hypothetical protein [Cellulomons edaphi]